MKESTGLKDKGWAEITEKASSLSELGRSGLTWDWSKMELDKQYFIPREDVLNMNMLWQLSQCKITEQAQKLNAEVLMWKGVIKNGWFIQLRQQR